MRDVMDKENISGVFDSILLPQRLPKQIDFTAFSEEGESIMEGVFREALPPACKLELDMPATELPERKRDPEHPYALQVYRPGEYISAEAKERARNRTTKYKDSLQNVTSYQQRSIQKDRREMIRGAERTIVQKYPIRASGERLYFCEDCVWKPMSIYQFWRYLRSSDLAQSLDVEAFTVYDVKELYQRLVANSGIHFDDEQGNPLDATEKVINLQDTCFYVTTLRCCPQDPDYFFTSKLNIWRKELLVTGAPVFEEFVDTSLSGDENLRQLLLEILGTLLSNYRPKNIFVFCGASNSGKSVIVDFLRWVLGVSAITQIAHLRDFSSRWTIGNLKGKKLLVCTECADEAIGADACAVIKTITGEPILTGEQKHKDATTFANTTRLLLVSNHLVHLDRVDAGFANRLVSLPFPCSIPFEQQDPNLLEHLLDEKGAIFNMAMQAVHALAARNFEYTTVDSGYLDKVSDQTLYVAENFDIGVQNFVTCCCALDTDGYTTSSDLYNAYREYANAQQFPIFKKVDMFCKVLYRLFPTLKAQKKYVNGKQCRCIKGIAIQIPSNAETHSEQEDISHE